MKKTAEQKRLDYESSRLPNVERKITPINELHFIYTIGSKVTQQSFITLEDLTTFLKSLNPMKLTEVKSNTTGILNIQGMGSGLTFTIL